MAELRSPKDTSLSTSIFRGSDVVIEFACHNCELVGKQSESKGRCQECRMNLCTNCIHYHRTMPALTDHHIDANGMIKTEEVTMPDIEGNTDYKLIKSRLEDLMMKSKEVISRNSESMEMPSETYAKVIQDIDEYRKEINDCFDTLKKNIIEHAMQIRNEDFDRIKSAEENGRTILTELRSISSRVMEAYLSKDRKNKRFSPLENISLKLDELEQSLAEMDDEFPTVYRVRKNQEFEKLVAKPDGIGSLQVRNFTKPKYEAYLRTRAMHDDTAGDYLITAVTVLTDKYLVISDETNRSVKLVATGDNKVLSELKVDTQPWQVTRTDEEHVAVTLPRAEQILILKYDQKKGLFIDDEISVDSPCWGIALLEDKLAVSVSDPTEIRLISMTGQVLQTFATDTNGDRLFMNPKYVTVNTHNKSIYVSDSIKNCVTMLDMTGKVRAVYTDNMLNNPRQVAVDGEGLLYLCGGISNNIHLLTYDCKKVTILWKKTDGMRNPSGASYCEAKRRLYIGMLADYVKIFSPALSRPRKVPSFKVYNS